MLEQLLALGLIPGTNIQITFNELIVLVLAFSAYYYVRLRKIDIKSLVLQKNELDLSRNIVRFRRLYLLTKKGTQIRLPL